MCREPVWKVSNKKRMERREWGTGGYHEAEITPLVEKVAVDIDAIGFT